MKVCLVAIPLIAGAMFFSGCMALYPGPGVVPETANPAPPTGIDPVTQEGIDASNAATHQQLYGY